MLLLTPASRLAQGLPESELKNHLVAEHLAEPTTKRLMLLPYSGNPLLVCWEWSLGYGSGRRPSPRRTPAVLSLGTGRELNSKISAKSTPQLALGAPTLTLSSEFIQTSPLCARNRNLLLYLLQILF